MRWYDNPTFDSECMWVGDVELCGDAWRRAQQLAEAGRPVERVVKVRGTTFRADAIARVVRQGVRVARLVPEPTNAFDPNAVKVIVNDEHVGYLPRGLQHAPERVDVCRITTDALPCVWLSCTPSG